MPAPAVIAAGTSAASQARYLPPLTVTFAYSFLIL